MLNQNGDGREGNRLQSKSGPKRSCNRSGTVPECKRPKKTGSYQSSPVFSLFGNLPEPVRVRLPSWDAKKPDRTGLSNTTCNSEIAAFDQSLLVHAHQVIRSWMVRSDNQWLYLFSSSAKLPTTRCMVSAQTWAT